MKHAIIPTDFSIASLEPVYDVIDYYPDQKVRITLLHLVAVPNSISHLLFSRHVRHTHQEIPAAFIQACEIIANKYHSRLAEIRTVIQCGETTAYLENLFDGLKADAIFIRTGRVWSPPFADSIDALALSLKCKFPVVKSAAMHRTETRKHVTIGDLLFAHNKTLTS